MSCRVQLKRENLDTLPTRVVERLQGLPGAVQVSWRV